MSSWPSNWALRRHGWTGLSSTTARTWSARFKFRLLARKSKPRWTRVAQADLDLPKSSVQAEAGPLWGVRRPAPT